MQRKPFVIRGLFCKLVVEKSTRKTILKPN